MRNNARSQRARKLVQPLEVGRIRHRDVQAFLIALERHKLMPHHQIDRDFSKQFVVDRRFAIGRQQIDKREPITAREFSRRLHLGRHDARRRYDRFHRPAAQAVIDRYPRFLTFAS